MVVPIVPNVDDFGSDMSFHIPSLMSAQGHKAAESCSFMMSKMKKKALG